ncbi:MAG: hypothetical protein GF308_16230 [Candidatus Heimdallarchaeota archaeon]|nr:hypothetical protein [Candidatus Heimdallarchaeota archaeon]
MHKMDSVFSIIRKEMESLGKINNKRLLEEAEKSWETILKDIPLSYRGMYQKFGKKSDFQQEIENFWIDIKPLLFDEIKRVIIRLSQYSGECLIPLIDVMDYNSLEYEYLSSSNNLILSYIDNIFSSGNIKKMQSSSQFIDGKIVSDLGHEKTMNQLKIFYYRKNFLKRLITNTNDILRDRLKISYIEELEAFKKEDETYQAILQLEREFGKKIE